MVSAMARRPGEGRGLWAWLATFETLSLGTRKTLFRALYFAPLGPGDSAAPARVLRRHHDLLVQIRRVATA
jgi:hypothetical protein